MASRIQLAEATIRSAGYDLVYQEFCEDAETPGFLGYYAGVTLHARRKVKIATHNAAPADIATRLAHELHHVLDPTWNCALGSR